MQHKNSSRRLGSVDLPESYLNKVLFLFLYILRKKKNNTHRAQADTGTARVPGSTHFGIARWLAGECQGVHPQRRPQGPLLLPCREGQQPTRRPVGFQVMETVGRCLRDPVPGTVDLSILASPFSHETCSQGLALVLRR